MSEQIYWKANECCASWTATSWG